VLKELKEDEVKKTMYEQNRDSNKEIEKNPKEHMV
jgi:hypothetical protein